PTAAQVVALAIEREVTSREGGSLFEAAGAYDWRAAIEAATSFEDIAAVFGRVFGGPAELIRHKPFESLNQVQQQAIRDEVERQKAAVTVIRDKDGRLLSPNGKVSKLGEEQYRTVRTPWFKEWAGDWETLAKQKAIDDFIDWSSTQQDPRQEYVLRDASEAEIREVLKQDGPDLTGMKHILSAQWIKHALGTHGTVDEGDLNDGKQRQLTVNDIKRIPEILDSYDGLTVQVKGYNKTSIIYSKLLPDGAIEYVERVLESSQKHKPRLVTRTAWVKTLAGVKSSLPRVYTPERDDTLPFSKGRVNPDSVTKVVDPETGEPMVVYHGTDAVIAEFGTGKAGENGIASGLGSFFTDNPDYASEYAEKLGGNVIPVMLSLKNPLMVHDYDGIDKVDRTAFDYEAISKYGKALEELENSEDKSDHEKTNDIYSMFGSQSGADYFSVKNAQVRKTLVNMGYDGVILKGDRQVKDDDDLVFVSFFPNQIKSAIGNIGTFSANKGSIAESALMMAEDAPVFEAAGGFDWRKAVADAVSFEDIKAVFE
ncbi:MAG: hypothetical protein ACOYOS_25240, partial [Syntrophales bacterium]